MLQGCTPWPDELARAYRAKGYWDDRTIPQFFNELAEARPDHVAVIDGAKRLTLSQWWDDSTRLAAHFHGLGLRKGDRVVFQMPNGADFFSVFLALTRIGAIPVMALPPHREEELTHFGSFSGAKALFIPERVRDFDFRPMAETVKAEVPSLKQIMVLGEALRQTELFPAPEEVCST